MKKKNKENKEKKLFLNKEKLRLLLKLWQMQFPPLARRVARRVRIVRNRNNKMRLKDENADLKRRLELGRVGGETQIFGGTQIDNFEMSVRKM